MIDGIPDDARYEVKFVAEPDRYHELELWIRLHRAGFRSAYPPRQVNNVYFDTPNLRAYAENLSGASARSKLRLRWYGSTDAPQKTTLEVKRRRNRLGWKLLFPGCAMDLTREPWGEVLARLRHSLPAAGRPWLDALPSPVLVNRYLRRYFVSADGHVRATLDQRQSVWDQRFRSRPNLRFRTVIPDSTIVEIKFDRYRRAVGSEAIAGIPIRVSRNSKYVVGVQAIISSVGA
jgi:hypothetical protein